MSYLSMGVVTLLTSVKRKEKRKKKEGRKEEKEIEREREREKGEEERSKSERRHVGVSQRQGCLIITLVPCPIRCFLLQDSWALYLISK